MVVIASGRSSEPVNPEQPLNAEGPILVTDSGSSSFPDIPVHPLKALSPIFVRELGSSSEPDKFLQFLKAALSIVDIDFPKINLLKVNPSKAFLPTYNTEFGITRISLTNEDLLKGFSPI